MKGGRTLEDQVVDTWNCHNEILLFLIDNIPAGAAQAATQDSPGSRIVEQVAHLDRVRRGWLQYHWTGKSPSLAQTRICKTASVTEPSFPILRERLKESGLQRSQVLADAMQGDVQVRTFGQSPVRWLGYLIAHESHHRGQIMLALNSPGCNCPRPLRTVGCGDRGSTGKDGFKTGPCDNRSESWLSLMLISDEWDQIQGTGLHREKITLESRLLHDLGIDFSDFDPGNSSWANYTFQLLEILGNKERFLPLTAEDLCRSANQKKFVHT